MAFSVTAKESTGEFNRGYELAEYNDGTYEFTLLKIEAGMHRNDYQGNITEKPAFRFIFQDDDGECIESNTINLPQGLAYNDRAKFWHYIGALANKAMDVGVNIEMDIEGVNSYEDLFEMPWFFTTGNTVKEVKSLKIDGVELIGSPNKVLLNLTNKTSSKGNNYLVINSVSAPAGSGGGKRKKQADVIPSQEASQEVTAPGL